MDFTNSVTLRLTDANSNVNLTIVINCVYASPQTAGRTMFEFDATQGSCRDYPTDWWYPIKGAESHVSSKKAISICKQCCVLASCLKYALANETHGIWGGMRESEREIERRRRGIQLSPQALSAMSAQTMRVSRKLNQLQKREIPE